MDKFHSIIKGNVNLYINNRFCNAESQGYLLNFLTLGKGLQEHSKNPSLREAQEEAESVMCSGAGKQKSVTFLYQQLNHTLPWINYCQLQHYFSNRDKDFK